MLMQIGLLKNNDDRFPDEAAINRELAAIAGRSAAAS